MPISYDSPFHPPEENEEGSISRMLLEVQGYIQPTTQHLRFIVWTSQDLFSPSYTQITHCLFFFKAHEKCPFLVQLEAAASNGGKCLPT